MLKSAFDKNKVRLYKYRPTFPIKRPDVQRAAPNLYDVKYKLVQPSVPSWSMKKLITNTSKVNTFAGPANYHVQNDNISHKINLKMKTDKRLMVSRAPFNSSSKR
uniref:Uncharacterized protein n=1 Tax=Sipha flava TaxID=143950 RepID=A0A2S2QKX2_9HEMI